MRRVLFSAAMLFAANLPAQSQQGLSASLGYGNGSLRFTCELCGSRSVTDRVLTARLGWANTTRSVIGLEYEKWERDSVWSSKTSVSWVAISLQGFAAERGVLRGAYAKGAIGLSRFRFANGRQKVNSVGGSVGIGYEINVTPRAAIVPYFDYLFATEAELEGWGQSLGGRMKMYGVALRVR